MIDLTFQELFNTHTGFRIHKWDHYPEVYERHLCKFKGKDINFLEIGIAHGGSLELWKKYFGAGSNYYGIDIVPECKQFERENVKIFIGSQGSHEFLSSIEDQLPELDILLDDGGHFVKDQIVSFHHLWKKIKVGGYYICEDVHTSYIYSYGGGYKRNNTFIEFVKNLIDQIHGWHSNQPRKLKINQLTKEIKGIFIYNGIVFIEKGMITQPTESIKGENQVPEPLINNSSLLKKIFNKLKKIILGFK